MLKDVKTIVGGVMQALQLPTPSYVVGNPDAQVGQALAALIDSADELVDRFPFDQDVTAETWLKSADGLETRSLPELDTDEVQIDSGVMYLATKWRFLEANGLDYSESFRAAEEKIARKANQRTKADRIAAGHEGGKATL